MKNNNGTMRSVIVGFLIGIVIVAAIFGIGYGVWALTHRQDAPENPGTKPGTITGSYYIEIGGDRYGNNGVATLASGNTFTVGSDFGTDYTVTMTASRSDPDFDFTLGAEPYKWSNVVGDDFTAGFRIAQNGAEFTVAYSSLAEIIAAAKGNTVTLADGVSDTVADKFAMTVTAANGYSVTVTFVNPPAEIVLDPDTIIFGGDGQGSETPEEPAEPEEPEEPEEPQEPEVPAMSQDAQEFVSSIKELMTGILKTYAELSDEELAEVTGDPDGMATAQLRMLIEIGNERYPELSETDRQHPTVNATKAILDYAESNRQDGLTRTELNTLFEMLDEI